MMSVLEKVSKKAKEENKLRKARSLRITIFHYEP